MIGTELTQPLAIGKAYFLSFYASVAYMPSQGFGIALNKIGIRLSTIAYSFVSPKVHATHAFGIA